MLAETPIEAAPPGLAETPVDELSDLEEVPVEEPTLPIEAASVEYVSLPWSIAGSGIRPTIINTCGLDSILWLLHFLETNHKLLVMPLVDSHISKELRQELFDNAMLELTGCIEKREDDMHLQKLGRPRRPVQGMLGFAWSWTPKSVSNEVFQGVAIKPTKTGCLEENTEIYLEGAFWSDFECLELNCGLAATIRNVTRVLV
mgnify:CR=1 FL=1